MRVFIKEKLCIEITGKSMERFLNIANQRCLNIYNIYSQNGVYYAFTTTKDYPKLCRAAQKTGCELTVISRYGMPYLLRNYLGRIGFIAGFFVFCFTLWFLSLFLWSVDIVGLPDEYTVSVSDALHDVGIRTGVLCSSIDGRMLELELEEKLPQFDMIRISRIGSNARIQFSASKPVKKLVKHREPCNLVAKENGQIVSVSATQGLPFVQEGDIVVSGDVLVSGVFCANGEYVAMVHSVGSVTALVNRTFSQTAEYRQIVTEPTGHTVNISRLMAFGIEIPLFSSLPKGNYSRTYEEYPLSFFGFDFPIVVRSEQWHELCYTEKELSREECINQAEKAISAKIRKTECIRTVSSERTITETDSGVRVTRHITLLKEITEEVPLLVMKNPEETGDGDK